MFNRRKFIVGSAALALPVVAGTNSSFGNEYRSDQEIKQEKKKPDPAQVEKPPQLDPEMVKSIVGKSHGDFEGVKELIGKEPMLVNAAWDWQGGDWETGLGAASHVGNRDIAEFLLEKGARIDMFAATMLGVKSIIHELLKYSPTIHSVPGPHGITLLCHAVVGREKADPVFDLILESGVDVNGSSNSGMTAMMMAASMERLNILEKLVEAGANVNQKDNKGKTAIDWAKGREKQTAVKFLESLN